MLKTELLGNSSAQLIYNDTRQSILNLPVKAILELFKSSGVLHFRGFRVNNEIMKVFAENFSSRFVLDKDRPIIDVNNKFVTLVDPGMHYIGPHCENANSPFRPDVVWFCCAVPAAEGGETLFWDGIQVWEEIGEDLRQLFLNKKIRFYQKFPAADWKRFLGVGATIINVKQMLDGIEGLNYQINKDESVSLEYICSCVVKTKYGNYNAFANSLISEYRNPRGIVTFEDGSQIPITVINQIQQVMSKLTKIILWQPGDLVMIDNSRFLHGRKSFNDMRRQIFSLLSYLK